MSGLLYQWGGIGACLIGSGLMLASCWAATQALPKSKTAEPVIV
jgi:Na+/phosphate symporter